MSGTASAVSFGTPMTLAVQRRSPLRVPRRDILVAASDTPTLELTLYQSETDTAPLNVSDIAVTISVYRERDQVRRCGWADYGFYHGGLPFIVATFPGSVVDAANGRIDVPVQANLGQWVIGRFWFEMTVSRASAATTGIGVLVGPGAAPVDYGQGNYTIAEGVIDFAPGAQIALTQAAELLGEIGPAIGSGSVVIPSSPTTVGTATVGPVLLATDGDTLVGADGALLLGFS